MGRYLDAAAAAAVERSVASLEAQTGVQVVTAVVGRSDAYVEIPWKAFALGASLAGFALVLSDVRAPQWTTSASAIVHAITILSAGAAAALAAAFVPAFGRLFLRQYRREEEVRQHAESLFLRHGCNATRNRTGVLLLVSLFERRVEIVHDIGFAGRVSEADWQSVIATMTPHLRNERPADALNEALALLGPLLERRGIAGRPDDTNELLDATIEERQ